MFFVTLQVQRYNIFMRFAIGFRGRFAGFCELRLFNRVLIYIIYWSSEHYPLLRQRGKTTKRARIPIKTVPDIAPGTHWWEENLTCMIFLSHASAEAPTATCAIICLSLLREAVFIVVPITFPNIVRFTSENANLILLTFCCNRRVLRKYEAIYHLVNFEETLKH